MLEEFRGDKKVQECQRRKDSKRFKIHNCFLFDSWFGWFVNQEGYGIVVLSTDWIVCSLTVGASESDEGLVLFGSKGKYIQVNETKPNPNLK